MAIAKTPLIDLSMGPLEPSPERAALQAESPSLLSLPHVAARLFNTPLLIEPRKLQVLLAALGHRFGVAAPSLPFVALSEERRQRPTYEVVRGKAVVPVFGVLVHRSSWMDALSGLTSYQRIVTDMQLAEEDRGNHPGVCNAGW